MSLRSPLGRVLGLGSAKDGFSHWWGQRVSAVALVVLGSWFAISLALLPALDYATVKAWVAVPFNTVALLLLVPTAAFHARLGVQVVIEDYIAAGWLKVLSLVVIAFVFVAAAVAGMFAVLRISFGVAP
ncbi:MAG: succinate dehydrogenase, hydrophobic membrane anchor protein [Gammaproteobacteria bacterium]|nr:succinate dehydrogenase, hydrophobic membrane anchor protein [Gammaproteobacteria bacterium]TVQ49635.1 MAG: succinate dehydrogenase, hydrophobic membrane anchor protein [Gammaproteobacteria bacterium]